MLGLSKTNDKCADGDTIQLQVVDFNAQQGIKFSQPLTVSILGGFGCDYLPNPGFTTITGKMTIK